MLFEIFPKGSVSPFMGRLKENAMMIAYQYANLKAAMFGAAVYYVSTAMWNTTIIEK